MRNWTGVPNNRLGECIYSVLVLWYTIRICLSYAYTMQFSVKNINWLPRLGNQHLFVQNAKQGKNLYKSHLVYASFQPHKMK